MNDLTSSHTQFIFPHLRHSDILQCLSELGIELTKAELMEPGRHRDRVKKVFSQVLEICQGVTDEDCEKVSPKMQETLQAIAKFPTVHEDFSDVKFFLELRKFMETCGYHDFGWKDLHTPTAKRFRYQLSAVINLAKFREDQLKLYAELNEPRTEMVCALEEVKEENAQLNEQLTATQMDSNNKTKEMEEVELECEELEIEIARSNKVQAAKRVEVTELKKKHNELKDELATVKLALQEAQVDYDSLQAKVVSSPGRRKKDLVILRDHVKIEREAADALEEEDQRTKATIVHVVQAIRDIPEAIRTVQEVLEGAKKISQANDETQKTKAERDDVSKETSHVMEQVHASEANLHRSDEKLAHTRKQYKLKKDAAQEDFESVKKQLVEVEKEHSDGVARVESGEAEIKAIQTQLERERAHTAAEIDDMVAQYRRLEEKVLDQNAALMTAIQTA